MSGDEPAHYLPAGLPSPMPHVVALTAPYWQGLREGKLLAQHCQECRTWQFGPEYICHACHAFDPPWRELQPRGRIFSWERVWHPSHPALESHGPYLVVLVELPEAGGIRMLGNLLGDPMREVVIGSEVEGVVERHEEADPPYALMQWRVITP